MNQKKILCFDFDGTIADSRKLEHESMIRTINYFGHEEINDDNLEDHFGPTEPGVIKSVLGEEYLASLPYFYNLYSELQSDLLKENPSITKMLETLTKTHPEIPLVLITGRSQETMEISLHYLGYDRFFKKAYSGSIDGINKDESMKQAMKDFDVDKEDMLYIGDTIADINTMKENGFDIFSAGYYQNEEEQKKLQELNPNTFKTVEELTDALLKVIA